MTIDYQLDDDIATLVLSRPDRYNAIDVELVRDLTTTLDRAANEARAAILTGAGKAFCAGADLAMLGDEYESGTGPDLGGLLDRVFHPMVESLITCRIPIVAAVNGAAAGAGLGLALACDLRVIAEDAFFTSAFTAIGLIPDSGTTWWLPHMAGVSIALEMTLTNRRMYGPEAVERGLAAAVVPGEALLTRAAELAADLAELPTGALTTARRLIRTASGKGLHQALADEAAEQARLGVTPEHLEGVKAFMEKRKPDFRNVRA